MYLSRVLSPEICLQVVNVIGCMAVENASYASVLVKKIVLMLGSNVSQPLVRLVHDLLCRFDDFAKVLIEYYSVNGSYLVVTTVMLCCCG